MDFRTELLITPATNTIGYGSEIVSIGSCFADVMGAALSRDKFNITCNPLGIIYNPISLWQYIFSKELPEAHFIERDELWYNLDFHSQLFGETKEDLEEKILQQITLLKTKLKAATHLVITIGTAWVYELKSTKKIVANCHKLPSHLFVKRLLSVEEITANFSAFYKEVKALNPTVHIIFTLSPVRHLKDTLPLNAVSKSVVRLVIHELTALYAEASYFPAYELLLDDLRDYRFYAEDLLHPSKAAEQYIMEKFYNAYLNENAKKTLEKVKQLTISLEHRAFHNQSEAHQKFLKDLLRKANNLSSEVNVQSEIATISAQLTYFSS